MTAGFDEGAAPPMAAPSQRIRLARNAAYNLVGMVVPAAMALMATPVLLAALGPTQFGIVSLQLAILVIVGVSDFGVSRAVVLVGVSAQGDGLVSGADAAVRAASEWTVVLCALLALVAILLTGASLAMAGEPLDRLGLSWLLVGLAGALSVPTLPLRARLELAERFDLLNLLRGSGASLLFLAPLLAVMVEASLLAVAWSHLVSRIVMLALFWFTAGRGVSPRPKVAAALLPALSARTLGQRHPVHATLLRRGSWIGLAGLASMVLAHVDRLALGLAASAVEVAHYVVAIEVVTKVWLVSGAIIAAVTPVIARTWGAVDGQWKQPFCLAVVAILLLAFTLHALFSLAGAPLLEAWLGRSFDPAMAGLLAVLSIGITINCLSQANYLLILIAGGERQLSWLQVAVVPLTFGACFLSSERFGASGVAWVFTIRMILDALVLRYFARRLAHSAGVGLVPLLAVTAAAVGLYLLGASMR